MLLTRGRFFEMTNLWKKQKRWIPKGAHGIK